MKTVPTNEERREAAKFFRELQKWVAETDESLGFMQLGRIVVENVVGKETGPRYTYKRLADLLEPAPERTCHDLGGEKGTVFEDYDFGCSACAFMCSQPEPNYCPNCGARVVDEDDVEIKQPKQKGDSIKGKDWDAYKDGFCDGYDDGYKALAKKVALIMQYHTGDIPGGGPDEIIEELRLWLLGMEHTIKWHQKMRSQGNDQVWS